jgi:cell division protein FtsW (lipid II flippase)
MNSTSAAAKPPTWYWVVSGLAVLWMLFGVMAWGMDLMTDEATVAELSKAQRQLYAARPQWLFVVYGVAIFSGLGGAIGLLMRKSWASMLLFSFLMNQDLKDAHPG